MAQFDPIRRGDVDFWAIDEFLDGLLRAKGFRRLPRKGSTSWVDPRVVPIDAAVRFKLCNFPGRIEYGVREEFVNDNGLTAEVIGCPDRFPVWPSGVLFIGFPVVNNAEGRDRLATAVGFFD